MPAYFFLFTAPAKMFKVPAEMLYKLIIEEVHVTTRRAMDGVSSKKRRAFRRLKAPKRAQF